MLVQDPPDDLIDRVTEDQWPAGDMLVHCWREPHGPDVFNPGFGGGRFHSFDAGHPPAPVSTWYAGEDEAVCLAESVFHDVVLGSGAFLAGRHLVGRRLSRLSLDYSRSLRLVQLHDPGLAKLGLRPRNLTDTTSYHYPRTVSWARAIHDQIAWAQGLVWHSSKYNTRRSLVLFGDRSVGAMTAEPPLALDRGLGLALVHQVAHELGILVGRVPPMP